MARITVPEPQIRLYEEGFTGHDLLDRAKTGKGLSDIVERIDEPLVIAVDGRWGSGKSFFLKCWVGAHRIENGGSANVIYFDAFQNDYLADPLIALVAAISRHLQPEGARRGALNVVKDAARKLARPAARITLAAMTGGATELAGPVMDAIIGATSEEATRKLEDLWAEAEGQHQAMAQFRAGLEALTAPTDGAPAKKLVLVIDELDRCRPDYALNLLEIAKHFFSVPNVHFVLGVNLEELQNSVKARYGQTIGAERYLQKFITMTIALADHDAEGMGRSVVRRYLSEVAARMELDRKVYEELAHYLSLPGTESSVTLRDVDRIMTYCALFPEGSSHLARFRNGRRLVMIGLIVFRATSREIYLRARNGTLTLAEVIQTLTNGRPVQEEEQRFYEHAEAAWRGFLQFPDGLDDSFRQGLFGMEPPRDRSALPRMINTQLEPVAFKLPEPPQA